MVLFTFQPGVKRKLEILLKLDFDHFWKGKVYVHLTDSPPLKEFI